MFSKTIKQLKILLVIVIVLICLPRSILPRQTSEVKKSDLDQCMRLNESELRLVEYKDNEEAIKLKLTQLRIINKSRKKYGAGEVKLDILASRVANKMCKEAAENKYISHWNLNGEKPYHRYAFAGGADHISENAFGEWSSRPYDTSFAGISEMMAKGHGSFMAERSPRDGHKKNIIDKMHNNVGIGFYVTKNDFRYYEEFIDRYFEFENIPAAVKVNEQSGITVKTIGNYFLYYIIIFREKVPVPMNVAQLKRTGSYTDYSNEEYLIIPAWDLARYRNGTTYQIPLKFEKDGLFYIHIYLDKKEFSKPSALNTKGKTEGCGIVIKVIN
jgi:uncharacterized protein YkwD